MADDRLFSELKQIEYSISLEWDKYPNEVFELFIFLIYLKHLHIVSPITNKKLVINFNKKENSNSESESEKYHFIWEVLLISDYESNLIKIIKDVLPNNHTKYQNLIKEPSPPNFTNDEKAKEYSLKKFDESLKLYDEVKKVIFLSIKFIDSIKYIYDANIIKEHIYSYLTDASSRFVTFLPLSMIPPDIFELFMKLSYSHIEKLHLSHSNNIINIVQLIKENSSLTVILKNIDLTSYILLNMFNIEYIGENEAHTSSTVLISDLSEIKEENIKIELDRIDVNRYKKTFIIVSRKNGGYEFINEFLTLWANREVLRTILYSPTQDTVILEFYSSPVSSKKKTIKLFSIGEIIKHDTSKVESFSDFDSTHSRITNEDFLQNGISFEPIFQLSHYKINIGDLIDVFYGHTRLNIKISRKRKSKEIITAVNGESIITKEDILNEETDTINSLKLVKIEPGVRNEFLKNKSIILSINDGHIRIKKFMPTTIVDKVLVAQGLYALILKDNKFEFESVYNQLNSAKFLKKFHEKVTSIKQSSKIIEILLSEEIMLSTKKTSEMKAIAEENKTKSEKNILNEFRHNTKGKINRTIQDVDELMDYLKNKNLLNDLLYDENNADINDIPKISANIQSLLTRILDDQKYVQKYLIHIKELFSEIEYDKFETIDIVEELTKIKSKLTKSNLCLIFPMQLGVFKIFAHKVYFMEIIEQLIDNAETYAFPDKKKKGILKFDLENIGETLRMIYSNDGKKFTVYESDYITMGKTTIKGIGTGYGGAMIFKYITAFNGKLKIIPCESMKIEFSFPTNKSKEIYNGSRI